MPETRTTDPLLVHYGPVYRKPGKPFTEHFLTLCRAGGEATMSTSLRWVNCEKCLGILQEDRACRA